MLRRIVRSYLRFVASCYRAGHDLGGRMGVALADRTADPEAKAARALQRAHSAIWALAGEADAAAAAGRFDRARDLYASARSRADALSVDVPAQSDLHEAFALVRSTLAWGLSGGMANVERAAGNDDAALAHVRSAATLIHDMAPGSLHEAVILNRLGVAYFDTFSIEAAVDAHEHAVQLLDNPAEAPPSRWTLPQPGEHLAIRSVILSSLGNAYERAGDRERAITLAAESLAALPGEAVGSPAEAGVRSTPAPLWFGDVDGAIAHLESALAIDRRQPDLPGLLVDLTNLGRAYLERGDVDQARAHLEEAAQIVRTSKVRGALALAALNNLAQLLARTGRSDAATSLFREALAACDGDEPRAPELAAVHANLAVHLLDAGRADDAVQQAEQGVRVAEAIRTRIGTQNGREQLSERLQLPYQALILALYARGDRASHARAFSVAEMSRARGLADTFGVGGAALPHEAASEQERRLRRRHSRARVELRRASTADEQVAPGLDALAHEERQLAWEVESAARRRSVSGRPPPDPPTIEAVQARLGATTLLLEYEVNARGVFVWSVRAHDAVLRRLTGDTRELMRLTTSAVDHLWSGEEITEEQRATHRELGRLLLGALPAHHLADANHIVVVSGMLGSLPLELLPVDLVPLAPHRLLGDLAPTSYLPSAAMLLALRSRRPVRSAVPTHGFLAVAPDSAERPMPAARDEVETAAATFLGSTVLTSPAATERAVLAKMAGARYVHFACHGYLDEMQPLESGLQLDPPTGAELADDECAGDILHLHSLLDVTLAADVVVCSACATGVGRMREGEGMVGFATAFLAAGARSLVLTLWPVVDRPTARLMKAFYAEIETGASPVTALWLAKRRMRSARPNIYGDPRHWAAFIAVGLPDDHPPDHGSRDVGVRG